MHRMSIILQNAMQSEAVILRKVFKCILVMTKTKLVSKINCVSVERNKVILLPRLPPQTQINPFDVAFHLDLVHRMDSQAWK